MPSGVTGTAALGVADALPAVHRAPGDRLGEDQRRSSSEAVLGQSLDGRIAARGHHQRRGQRGEAQADVVAKVEPARLRGQVQSEHDQ